MTLICEVALFVAFVANIVFGESFRRTRCSAARRTSKSSRQVRNEKYGCGSNCLGFDFRGRQCNVRTKCNIFDCEERHWTRGRRERGSERRAAEWRPRQSELQSCPWGPI